MTRKLRVIKEVSLDKKVASKNKTGSNIFEAELLSVVEIDNTEILGKSKNIRPVYIVIGGTEREMESFVANLRPSGKADKIPSCQLINIDNYSYGVEKTYEFPKNLGYKWSKQVITKKELGVKKNKKGEEVETEVSYNYAIWTGLIPNLVYEKPDNYSLTRVDFVNILSKEDTKQYSIKNKEDVIEYFNNSNLIERYKKSIETIMSYFPHAVSTLKMLSQRVVLPIIQDESYYLHLFMELAYHNIIEIPKEFSNLLGTKTYCSISSEGMLETNHIFPIYLSNYTDIISGYISRTALVYKDIQNKLDNKFPHRVYEREFVKNKIKAEIDKLVEFTTTSSFPKTRYESENEMKESEYEKLSGPIIPIINYENEPVIEEIDLDKLVGDIPIPGIKPKKRGRKPKVVEPEKVDMSCEMFLEIAKMFGFQVSGEPVTDKVVLTL
jgi:hypothetical protein